MRKVMDMILTISSIKKSFQGIVLLEDISFNIDDHDKIAIIGNNGVGKSTLLKIICDEESYDSGELHINNNYTIGYLSQHNTFERTLSVYDALLEVFKPVIEKEKRLRELEIMMSQGALEETMKEYDQLLYEFERDGGYSYTSQIKGVLKGLDFDEEHWNQPIGELSGGQKTRIALGRLLLSKPDLLLLDEPTNHLDVSSIEWLEGFLKNYPNALVVVSHDRYFIDQVTHKIIDIENGKSKIYKCKYSEYASIKKQNRDIELKHYVDNQKEIKRMQESIATLKSYNREKQVKRAESKEKALERMAKVDKPSTIPDTIRIQFQPAIESGNDVLTVKDLSMSFDQPLFSHLSFEVKKRERVAIIGKNGIGKTTLFRILLEELYPDSGKFIIGSKVMIGYYDQEHASLSNNKTIFEEISDAYPKMTNTEIRNICASFLFKGEDVFKTMDVLSGGEKSRVVLMKLLLSKSNFLVLDEPTNHLDIESKEILEDALLDFEGTILFISHDRYFINKIATKIVAMEEEGSMTFIGNYDDYMSKKIPDDEIRGTVKNKDYLEAKKQQAQKRKQENNIKKIEKEITQLEEEINDLNELLHSEDIINDYKKYNEYLDEVNRKEELLEEKLVTWEDLQF